MKHISYIPSKIYILY